MNEAIHSTGGEIRSGITGDISKTYHWSASIAQGRPVLTKASVKPPKKRNKAQMLAMSCGDYKKGWQSKYSPKKVIRICKRVESGEKIHVVAKSEFVAPKSLYEWLQVGGLYEQAKFEVGNG